MGKKIQLTRPGDTMIYKYKLYIGDGKKSDVIFSQ